MFAGVCISLITVQTICFANGATTSTNYIPLKYPGPIKEVTNRYGTSDDGDDIPEACKGKSFCTIKPPDYPQNTFNNMFKGYKPVAQAILVMDDTFGNRQGDPEDTDGCESEVTYEPLYKVRNKRGDWRTVVQAPDENFVQRVRLEQCVDTKSRCFAVFHDDSFETFCKQKYNVWEILVATGAENNATERIKTELPVCCSCHYRLKII